MVNDLISECGRCWWQYTGADMLRPAEWNIITQNYRQNKLRTQDAHTSVRNCGQWCMHMSLMHIMYNHADK